jgi:uncharacterized protein
MLKCKTANNMSMNLKEQLTADLNAAMRAGDNQKRDVLRLMMAAIKQTEVDSRILLDDSGVQEILRKQLKQRQESISDFEKAGRQEEVEREKAEMEIIEGYLPQMMTREEIEQIASGVISELQVTDIKAMGQVMGRLMPHVKGRADGKLVNEVVRSLLS